MNEVQKLSRIRSLLEHLNDVEALANEASAMAQDAERDGHTRAAEALWDIAHHHRATVIQCQARYAAFGIVGISDEKGGS